MFWGEPNPRWAELPDATAWWERGPLLAMTAVIVAIGVYPAWMMDVFELGVTPIAERFGVVDVIRFAPDLALLIAAGLIVVIDAIVPRGGALARNRRVIAAGLALVGIAVSIGCSLSILLS